MGIISIDKNSIVNGLIVAAISCFIGVVWKLSSPVLKNKKISKFLLRFCPKTREKLESYISCNESDITEEDIEWILKKRWFCKYWVTAYLEDVVQNGNSRESTKEKNAVTILSHVLSPQKGLEFLKNIIKDKDINQKITDIAILSLNNVLNKAQKDIKKDIRKLVFEELMRGRHKTNAIVCLRSFQDDETLLKLLENIIDGSAKIAAVAIDSLDSICNELKEGIPKFFYHYAKLILLISEEPKIVNSMIEILQGQKDSSSAKEVIEFMIDNGRFSEDNEKGKWTDTNRMLTRIGD